MAQGININSVKVLTLALSNGLVALSGALLAKYQGFSDVNMGRGAIVIGLAAVIIGEVLGGGAVWKTAEFFRTPFVCSDRRNHLLHCCGCSAVAEDALQ